MQVPQSYIEESVHNALKEDLGAGDITASLIDEDATSIASVISREAAVICGVDWFEEVFQQLDPEIYIDWDLDDGDRVEPDQQICSLSGPTARLLSGERTALNFLQTLSGTATIAAQYAAAVADTGCKILDTRKTVPGLRIAQKYAVSCGGCYNHRIGLFDAILIKENHIAAAGSIAAAVELARFNNPGMPVEVEVENLDELQQGLDVSVERILLDNFSPALLSQAVEQATGKTELEASGGITLENIRHIAETGVNYISVGALTKDIRAIDLSMHITL